MSAVLDTTALQAHVAELERENSRLTDRLDEIERQNAKLANLYVSLLQLHETLDRSFVVRAIKEVIVNLVGSEQMGIFEVTPDGRTMNLVESMGIDAAHYSVVRMGDGPIGTFAARGEMFVAPNPHVEDQSHDLTAFIPLRVDGHVIGAVAVFGLLPQKGTLEPVDFELFDLLSTQAALALYCSRTVPRQGHA